MIISKRCARRALLAFAPLNVRFFVGIAVLPLMLVLAGCGGGEPGLPELTEAEGTVLLGGQPLPFAKITFNPTKSGLPANSIGIGVTDEAGKFKLITAGKAGAVPGEHVITIGEGPPPEDVRGQESQDKMTQYLTSLKNRPIPSKYENVNKSNAKITVTKDQKEYKVELSR
jgi:hypothetical protein